MGIFATLFGNPNSDIVNSKIDSIIDNLPLRQADKQFDNLVSGALTDIINFTGDKATDDKAKGNLNDIEKLLEGISIPEQRLRRYDVYDDIYKGLQLVKRIIKVYISNIFQKDPVSNTSILLKDTEISKNFEKLPEIKQLIHNILKFFKIDEKLKYNTAFNMLKYGDSFIELVDLSKISSEFPAVTASDIKQANAKKVNKDEAIITEYYHRINSKNEYINSIDLERFADVLVEFNNEVYVNEADYSLFESTETNETPTDGISLFNLRLQKIILKFHKPHKVIPLVSVYDNILGYVEMKEVNKQSTSTNVLKQFTDIIDKIGSKTNNKENKYDDVLKDLSKLIVKKMLITNNVVKPMTNITNDEYEDLIQTQLGDELFFSLKRTIVGLDANTLFRKKLSVRFIKPENIFWFKTPSSDHYPYGCSVIDPLVLPSKLKFELIKFCEFGEHPYRTIPSQA